MKRRMEAATAFRSPPLSIARPPNLLSRSRISALGGAPDLLRFKNDNRWIKRAASSFSHSKHEIGRMVTSRNSFIVRATSSKDSVGSVAPIAPLQLESPVGQFLSEILVSHPHLVAAAIEQQLDQLQTDLDTEKQKDEFSASDTDLVLYRRIAEVKANERRQALEEIFYALVVQKFMDANVSLVPSISSSSNLSNRVDMWPSQEDKLERLHSPEAYEMIQNHLALILGNKLGDSTSVAQVSKLRVGQVYAASIMYGYFLKRVDQRFQLEKAMKTLPQGRDVDDEAENVKKMAQESFNTNAHPEIDPFPGGVSPSRLRSYVMSFDGETLQRCATIKSKEAVTIIEKHTEALFGRPEIVVKIDGSDDESKDELIKIGFNGLRRLVLEAVTFGAFLWDVESYVESTYPFVMN